MNQIASTHKPTNSSRESEYLNGKSHVHVMCNIRAMCEQVEIDSTQFWCEYQDSTGRTLPCFELDRHLTYYLLTGLNGCFLVQKRKVRASGYVLAWLNAQKNKEHLGGVFTALNLEKGTARINAPC